jgi:N-glycosidase YbiA
MFFRGKYNFLSNFYPCQVEYEGMTYSTVEHAYQAAKFDDDELKKEIKNAETPGKSKRLAREYSEHIRNDWNKIKVSVMYELLCEKFMKNETLKQKLINIDEPIVEHNVWNDTFWGVCDGNGKNTLGKLLEKIKNEILLFDI